MSMFDDSDRFIFSAKPGGPAPTYEQLQMRRKIAQAMMGQKRAYPKTLGEGLTSVGENIADIAYMKKLEADDQARAALEEKALGGALNPQQTNSTVTPDVRSAYAQADDEALPPVATGAPPVTPPVTPPPVTPLPTDAASTVGAIAPAGQRDQIASTMVPPPAPPAAAGQPPVAALPPPADPTFGIKPAPPPPVVGPQLAQAAPPIDQLRAPTTEPRPPKPLAPTPQMQAITNAMGVVGDPLRRSQLQKTYDFLQQQQQEAHRQEWESYRNDLAAYRGAPKAQADLTKATTEADVLRRTGGVGNEALLAPLIKSSETVKGLPAAAMSINNARQQLQKGMFTGTGADQQLALFKTREAIGRFFGIDGSDPRIANTETFRATIMPMVAQMRASVSGNANISDADIKLAMQAAGGELSLDAKTFPRVLDALERINLATAIGHQQKALGAAAGNESAATALQGVYGLPMEQIIPSRQIQKLREHPETAAEFDSFFKTPGLAARILKGK